jgi:hypothetical protein
VLLLLLLLLAPSRAQHPMQKRITHYPCILY